MKNSQNTTVEYLTLGLTVILTMIGIFNQQISVFYMVFLFWWDELIKTIFQVFRWLFKKSTIPEPSSFISRTRGKFFFLFVYLIFIVVFLGFIMNWKNENLVLLNGEVLFFQNQLFNFSLVGFFLREIYILINQENSPDNSWFISRGIITLHISLILGIFGWFLINNVFPQYLEYASLVAAIPFLLIKIFFEIGDIRAHEKQRKQLKEIQVRNMRKKAYQEILSNEN